MSDPVERLVKKFVEEVAQCAGDSLENEGTNFAAFLADDDHLVDTQASTEYVDHVLEHIQSSAQHGSYLTASMLYFTVLIQDAVDRPPRGHLDDRLLESGGKVMKRTWHTSTEQEQALQSVFQAAAVRVWDMRMVNVVAICQLKKLAALEMPQTKSYIVDTDYWVDGAVIDNYICLVRDRFPWDCHICEIAFAHHMRGSRVHPDLKIRDSDKRQVDGYLSNFLRRLYPRTGEYTHPFDMKSFHIIVPINIRGNHWVVLDLIEFIGQPHTACIRIFDSLYKKNQRMDPDIQLYINWAFEWFNAEVFRREAGGQLTDERLTTLKSIAWQQPQMNPVVENAAAPLQENGVDCGVYCAQAIKHLAARKSLHYGKTTHHAAAVHSRKMMTLELLCGRLMRNDMWGI